MIGLFDSGLGGLTVIRRLRERLPNADIVYFADQAHVPYGDREPEELFELLVANLGWLDAQGVDAIVMACNTSCAIAQRYGWPSTRSPVFDIIDSAATAVQRAGYRRVGVVATAATVDAGSYGRTLRAAVPGAEVWEVAAPALVPMIEAGRLTGTRAARRGRCRLPRTAARSGRGHIRMHALSGARSAFFRGARTRRDADRSRGDAGRTRRRAVADARAARGIRRDALRDQRRPGRVQSRDRAYDRRLAGTRRGAQRLPTWKI